MKKVIAILALAAAPVIFAQEKPVKQAATVKAVSAETSKVDQSKKQADNIEAVKKEEAAKMAEQKKVEASRSTVNKAPTPVSLKEASSKKATTTEVKASR